MNEKELLEKVFKTQILIYKKIRGIEDKLKGSTHLADFDSYKREIEREIDTMNF